MRSDADAIIASLSELGLDPDEAAYLRLHSCRYALLLAGLRARLAEPDRGERPPRILDVGPGLQTTLIRRAFPEVAVDSIGFASVRAAPRQGERHVDFDLNRAGEHPRRPALDPYGAIVFAEVLEHLATSPREVLGCLATWLAPGAFLVVQTPNALALHKRLRALAGRNPLGAGGGVTAPSHSPAHFREYTLAELDELGRSVGLEPEAAMIANHFRHPGLAGRAYDRLTAALPAGTRQGITLYLRRPRARP
jgi:hypothetical protein